MSSAPTAESGGAASSDAISIVQRGNYSASAGGSAIQARLGDALPREGY